MKIINMDFEEIENFQNIDFDSIIKQMVKYIATFNLSNEEIEEIYIHLKNTIIEYTDGKVCTSGHGALRFHVRHLRKRHG